MHDAEPNLPLAERALRAFLQALGVPLDQDPELTHTVELATRAFGEELLAGYRMDPAEVLRSATRSDARSVVVVRDLPTTLLCPHHLLPAVGRVHVGYVPGGRVAGFGAIARLVRCFSRRLVLQEDFVRLVVEALLEHLGARGAGCVASMNPTCLTSRGPEAHGSRAITSYLAGPAATDPALSAALLSPLSGGPYSPDGNAPSDSTSIK